MEDETKGLGHVWWPMYLIPLSLRLKKDEEG